MEEESRWYPYKITSTPAAYYHRLQNLVPNKSWDIGMRPYDYMYSKYLIFIFTNIKEHIRISQVKNSRKLEWLDLEITYISAAIYPGLPNMVPNKN